MALDIDATPIGTSTNNSYVTLAESNTYFDSRLNVTDWTGATDDIKNRALASSTRQIDYNDFYGDREFDTQALKFPRTGLGTLDGVELDSIIPIQVKEATYEMALYMLSVDTSKPSTDGVVTKEKVGSLEIHYKYDSNDNLTQSSNTLPPNVLALLAELSPSIGNGAFIDIGR